MIHQMLPEADLIERMVKHPDGRRWIAVLLSDDKQRATLFVSDDQVMAVWVESYQYETAAAATAGADEWIAAGCWGTPPGCTGGGPLPEPAPVDVNAEPAPYPYA